MTSKCCNFNFPEFTNDLKYTQFFFLFTDCDVNLPLLPSYLKCHLDDSCFNVTCCLEVSKIHRTFSLQLFVDMCLYEMHFAVENYRNEISMIKFDFGKSKPEDLLTHFRLNKPHHNMYWKSPISVLGISGYVI